MLPRKTIIAGCITFIWSAGIAQAEQVCNVHDGDTIKLCTGQSIRFHGIDSPELHQPMGFESRDYLMAFLKGKSVDLNCKGKSFKRQVCRIWANGQDVEEEMVSKGWAFDYPKYSKGQYAQAQTLAKSQQLGVWKLPNGGIRPWDWRYAHRVHPTPHSPKDDFQLPRGH